MKILFDDIKESLGGNFDFFHIKKQFGECSIIFMGLNSLIDLPKTLLTIESYLELGSIDVQVLVKQLKRIGEIKHADKDNIISLILEGKLILYILEENEFVVSINPLSPTLNSSIASPSNESIVLGPLITFNEDLNINIGLMRKELFSEKLQIKLFSVGKDQKRKLSVLYCDDHVDSTLLENVMRQIERNKSKELNNNQDLSKLLGITNWNLISAFKITEIPRQANIALLKGRVVIFIDRIPLAYVTPGVFWDLFSTENDLNFSKPITLTLRTIRIVGFLLTLIVPALYVTLVSVNPEVLRIELALSVAKSREGVPYPAIIELIIMLFVQEFIIEASLRLPKSIGPTITMVGAIILGQAAVDAKLVSNLLIIILAAVTIANSTIVGLGNLYAVRIFKYGMLILASIYGVLGILSGIFIICTYLSSVRTLGIPYLFYKFTKGGLNSE